MIMCDYYIVKGGNLMNEKMGVCTDCTREEELRQNVFLNLSVLTTSSNCTGYVLHLIPILSLLFSIQFQKSANSYATFIKLLFRSSELS